MEDEYYLLTLFPITRKKKKEIFHTLKNEHIIIVNTTSPTEKFMFVNPPSEKPETPQVDSKACVRILQNKRRERRQKVDQNMYLCVCNYRLLQ